MAAGVFPSQILVLTPHRSLQGPYLDLLLSPNRKAGSEPTLATIGGLARRTCELFWPFAAKAAGFGDPDQPPVFLTLETAQYYVAHVVRPLLKQGYFESVTIDRSRLYSQIIDNLNKSAAVGFPHTEIGSRLESAFRGQPVQHRIYAEAQECASHFRAFCLAHNFLDFSLQLTVFMDHLLPLEAVRSYLSATYRHLIYDNPEEDVPRAHDFVRGLEPQLESMLIIYDDDGGVRSFLGADPVSAHELRQLCRATARLDVSFVMSQAVMDLEGAVAEAIRSENTGLRPTGQPTQTLPAGARNAISLTAARYYPELLDDVAECIKELVGHDRVPPSEIVVVGPYLSDALRFALTTRLHQRGLEWYSLRPSRSLREEPATRTLITLASLAHPHWGIEPSKYDVAYSLMGSLHRLDLIRAQLLAEIVYRPRNLRLTPFGDIRSDMRARITDSIGARYTRLREWLLEYREASPLPLDYFLRRLFGEVISQPGYGFHSNLDSVRVVASLVESIHKFRTTLEPAREGGHEPDLDVGKEYVGMLHEGVIAASYSSKEAARSKDAVLIAPAHAFLILNRPVAVQFWLDVGSSGWYQRIAQPLTQPYVLSRRWELGRAWQDADELRAGEETLTRLCRGLLRRCRERVYVCASEFSESGHEQRGELLRVLQSVLSESQ